MSGFAEGSQHFGVHRYSLGENEEQGDEDESIDGGCHIGRHASW